MTVPPLPPIADIRAIPSQDRATPPRDTDEKFSLTRAADRPQRRPETDDRLPRAAVDTPAARQPDSKDAPGYDAQGYGVQPDHGDTSSCRKPGTSDTDIAVESQEPAAAAAGGQPQSPTQGDGGTTATPASAAHPQTGSLIETLFASAAGNSGISVRTSPQVEQPNSNAIAGIPAASENARAATSSTGVGRNGGRAGEAFRPVSEIRAVASEGVANPSVPLAPPGKPDAVTLPETTADRVTPAQTSATTAAAATPAADSVAVVAPAVDEIAREEIKKVDLTSEEDTGSPDSENDTRTTNTRQSNAASAANGQVQSPTPRNAAGAANGAPRIDVQNIAQNTAQGTAQNPGQAATSPAGFPPNSIIGSDPAIDGLPAPRSGLDVTGPSASFHAEMRAALHAPAQASAYAARGANAVQPAVNQIALQISRAAGESADRLTIQLNPASLGRIKVELEVSPDHRLLAVISAEKAETLDFLQRDVRSLERALADAGLKTDAGSLEFGLARHGGEGAAGDGRSGDGPARAAMPTGTYGDSEDAVALSNIPRLVPEGRVDIQV